METKQLLDELAELRQMRDVMALPFQETIADLQAKIDDVCSPVDVKIDKKEKAIKDAVLVGGETVKGDVLMAMWSKGRTSWNTKGLEGVIAIYPDIAKLKEIGEPSVSIRAVK